MGYLSSIPPIEPGVCSKLDTPVSRVIVYSMNNSADNTLATIPEHQIQRFQELIFKLYQCCQQRIQHQSERFDLPDAELRCLRLFGKERYLTPKGIADQMGVVKSRITKIINGLVGRNLVQRYKDPEDSRITLISLTPQGKKKLCRINVSLSSANMDILSRVTPEKRNALLDHLEVLRASMEAARNA